MPIMPISACYARLASLFAGVRLQLLLSSEFTNDECLSWSAKLQEETVDTDIMEHIIPIIERLQENPSFVVNDLRRNLLLSNIIAFTAGVEYFLEDNVILCMRRNSGLRKKAFSTYSIPAIELESDYSTREIRMKHIYIIAQSNTSGKLFSQKFKKVCTFLDIGKSIDNKQLFESLDSIWRLRNEFAHSNQTRIQEYNFQYKGSELTLKSDSNKSQYFYFVIKLCEIFENAVNYLHEFDILSLSKWSADSFLETE